MEIDETISAAFAFVKPIHDDMARTELHAPTNYAQPGRVQMGEWRPIESAPKDGRRILLCKPGMKEAWTGMWAEMKRVPDRWEWSLGAAIPWEPTLWQPLPEPPDK